MRSPFREPPAALNIRIPQELKQWLTVESTARRVSVTKLIVELLETQRVAGGGVTGLLEHLKEVVGEALISQRDEAKALREEVRVLRAMLSHAYLSYLQHTKPVPVEEQPKQKQEAERRYTKWEDAIKADMRRATNGHGTT